MSEPTLRRFECPTCRGKTVVWRFVHWRDTSAESFTCPECDGRGYVLVPIAREEQADDRLE